MSAVHCPYSSGTRSERGWDTLYAWLITLPTGLLAATLLSDALYWLTGAAVCERVSEWLLGFGLATAALAAGEALARYLGVGSVRPSRVCSMHVVGNLLALVLTSSNLVFRLKDDSLGTVVPAGLTMTSMAVCMLIAAAYLGKSLAAEARETEVDPPAEGQDDDDDADEDWDL